MNTQRRHTGGRLGDHTMRTVTAYATKNAAEAALADAIRQGRVTSGYVAVNFSGAGGRTVYHAHAAKGALSFCL